MGCPSNGPHFRPTLLQRLSTALYVADLVSQFSKQLGFKALHYDQLEAALAGKAPAGCPVGPKGRLDHTACTACTVRV